MNAKDAAAKLRMQDGQPVVSLLTNPHGGPDGKGMFVSMVEAGANLVDFTTVRSAGIEPAAIENSTYQNGGAGQGARWWERFLDWRSWFGADGQPVARSTDFNAEFAAGEFNNAMWRGWYVLEGLIYDVLQAPDIGDKRKTIALFIDQFRDMLISKLPANITTEETIELARIARSQVEIAKRAGKVISAANMDKLLKARAAIKDLDATIGSVIDAGGGGTSDATTARAAADPAAGLEASVPAALDPATVKAAALAASDAAITIHRQINPGATPGELTKVGQEAAAAVFRAAVMGPAQPAMPTNALEAQIAQYGQLSQATDPTNMALSKLAGELVARELSAKLEPMSKKLDEIVRLASEHDVALFGGKVQRTKPDGTVEVVEIGGILGGKGPAPAGPSGGAPETPVARGAGGSDNGGGKEHGDALGIGLLMSPRGNKS